MKTYLIRFNYDHYCQGYETEMETVLVYAQSFEEACAEIKKNFRNARDFSSLTFSTMNGKIVR